MKYFALISLTVLISTAVHGSCGSYNPSLADAICKVENIHCASYHMSGAEAISKVAGFNYYPNMSTADAICKANLGRKCRNMHATIADALCEVSGKRCGWHMQTGEAICKVFGGTSCSRGNLSAADAICRVVNGRDCPFRHASIGRAICDTGFNPFVNIKASQYYQESSYQPRTEPFTAEQPVAL